MPELPKACVRCGTPYGLTRQPYTLRNSNDGEPVDLLFCVACWRGLTTARHLSRIAIVLVLLVSLGGLALAVASESYGPFVVGAVLGLLIFALAFTHSRGARPRVISNEGTAELDIPGHGRVRIV